MQERVITCALLAMVSGTAGAKAPPKRPRNVVFIVADDLGFNDVSFHGSPQIPTPNLDYLARTGVVLMNHNVQPVCTPTRSTILSGRHVIHTGIYMPFAQGTAYHLGLNYTLLPEYMRRLNRSTHMVGKWHLGQNTLSALPTGRGFDSYFGYWSGAEDYYTHTCRGAYDLADGVRSAFEWNGTYSTPLFTERAVRVIEDAEGSDKPFFLYLAYQNVHWPLQAPQKYLDMFTGKTGGDDRRQAVCAMAKILDDGIGNVTAALRRTGALDDTLIVFTSDNGGPTNNNENTQSNNYPMRGGKNTIWNGGHRVAAFVRAGPGVLADDLIGSKTFMKFHASDWIRTITHAVTGDPKAFDDLVDENEPPYLDGDGMDVWAQLAENRLVRDEILHEAHAESSSSQVHGNAITVGDWKLLRLGQTHPQEEAGWHPPPGQDPSTVTYALGCDISKQPQQEPDKKQCVDKWCLFNVTADPCEYNDVAAANPEVVTKLAKRLAEFQAAAVEPLTPLGCNPVVTDGAWRPCDSPNPNATIN